MVSVTELPEKFQKEWPKITFFGDSITRYSMDVDNGCWAAMVAAKVSDYFSVDIRGFPGYNSRQALAMMDKLFPRSYLDKVEIFVPFFGHNDSWEADSPIHVPVDEYEQNMRDIIKYLTENGLPKDRIILISPGWYHAESFTKWAISQQIPPVKKDMAWARKYGEAVMRIAEDEGLALVNFWVMTTNYNGIFEKLFCDGIHLSKQGAKYLYSALMPVIEGKIRDSWGKPVDELVHTLPYDRIPEYVQKLSENPRYGDHAMRK